MEIIYAILNAASQRWKEELNNTYVLILTLESLSGKYFESKVKSKIFLACYFLPLVSVKLNAHQSIGCKYRV